MHSIDVLEELSRLITEGAITEQALQAMTQIDSAKLHAALESGQHRPTMMVSADGQLFTNDENMRLSMLAGHLANGMSLPDDERLTSIVESLIGEVHLTVDNVARLADVSAQDVSQVLHSPEAVPAEVKYAIAIRTSYLINVINTARGR